MAEYHHNSPQQPQQQQQQNYFAQIQHQQQFMQQQQRPPSQPMMQPSPQQQQMSGGNGNAGIAPAMQHNFISTHQQNHQQMQHQIRSVPSPHQHAMMQQRQQAGFSHPGMMQHMRQQMQQQQGSPQQPQMFHQQQQQVTAVQQRHVIRPVGVASPHQQANAANPGSQQHFVQQFGRQPGMQNIIQVTSSSPSSTMMSSHSQQQQFVQSNQQFGNGGGAGGQSQMRQMLPPQNTTYRQVIIRDQSQSKQVQMRFPGKPSNSLSPQQELQVLQQHFPGAQLQQSSSYPSMQHIQHQQHPQQRFIAHQQLVHPQHQQMTSTVSIGGQPQPVSVFVTASNQQSQQQQQQYAGPGIMQQSQLRPQQSQFHHPNFASPTHPSIHAQQQHQGMPTLTANGGQQMQAEYGASFGLNTPETGRVSIKQEQEPSPVALEQSMESPNSPSTESQGQASNANASAKNKKPVGKPISKGTTVSTSQKSGGTAIKMPGNKTSPADEDLIRASGPNQTTLKLLDREALDDFVKSVDPNEVLEDEVVDALQLIMDDFVDDIIRNSAQISKHRGSSKLEARDVRFVLAHNLGMAVPSESLLGGTVLSSNIAMGASGGQPPSKRPALVAHQQRMALIDKTLKKL